MFYPKTRCLADCAHFDKILQTWERSSPDAPALYCAKYPEGIPHELSAVPSGEPTACQHFVQITEEEREAHFRKNIPPCRNGLLSGNPSEILLELRNMLKETDDGR